MVVLLTEFVDFRPFPSKGPDHPDAGEIFLGHGGELALVLVAFHEAVVDLLVEMGGIGDDQGRRNQGNKGQRRVHGHHEGDGQDQQDQDAENTGQLLGQEVLGGLNVRGAALDDVAGLVFHVPGEGQPLDVGEQPVPHGLDQGLGGLGIEHPEGILGHHLEHSHENNRQSHDPKMLSQIGETADAVHKIHYKSREVSFLAADGTVHGGPNDLGLDHIRQGRHAGREDRCQKKPF